MLKTLILTDFMYAFVVAVHGHCHLRLACAPGSIVERKSEEK